MSMSYNQHILYFNNWIHVPKKSKLQSDNFENVTNDNVLIIPVPVCEL